MVTFMPEFWDMHVHTARSFDAQAKPEEQLVRAAVPLLRHRLHGEQGNGEHQDAHQAVQRVGELGQPVV